jgi:hypothetical protein
VASDNTALVIACISGAFSLAAVVAAERSRRKSATLTDQLTRKREAESRAESAMALVRKYRDPLLSSAFDLQSRIYNIYARGFTGRRDPEYFRLNTVFLIADLLGWLEIIRRELQFLDLGAVDQTKKLGQRLDEVKDVLASTTSATTDELYIYRGQQRAIGELMLCAVEGEAIGRRHECIGYAKFVENQSKPEFAKWFQRLGDAVDQLPDGKPKRLVDVQHSLIRLIDLLDPDCERYQAKFRKRLPAPSRGRARAVVSAHDEVLP